MKKITGIVKQTKLQQKPQEPPPNEKPRTSGIGI